MIRRPNQRYHALTTFPPQKVFEYSTFGEGFLSTVQIMIGNGDYFLLDTADKIAAPLFYYPFIMIMIFVVFNMTIGACLLGG